MSKIRIAIVGVGNCASALVQGIEYYSDPESDRTGLTHPLMGGYSVSDMEVVAAFDVVEGKVGKPLSNAIVWPPNETIMFCPSQNETEVLRGPTLDGLGRYLREVVEESAETPVDVVSVLKAAAVDVVVSYLPVGSEQAARYYALAAITAGCGYVNCMPAFIASDPEWAERFRVAGLPIIGDDIKSQVGATIVHRELVTLFRRRGVTLDRTSQLNVGGNADFLNMLERDRLTSKKISKTNAVVSVMGTPLPARDVHIGPSDHVAYLTDRKRAFISLEGRGFGGAPIRVDVQMEVWDSPNSAGIVIDAIRCVAAAKRDGLPGALIAPSAAFMKTPPRQMDDALALQELDRHWVGDPDIMDLP